MYERIDEVNLIHWVVGRVRPNQPFKLPSRKYWVKEKHLKRLGVWDDAIRKVRNAIADRLIERMTLNN